MSTWRPRLILAGIVVIAFGLMVYARQSTDPVHTRSDAEAEAKQSQAQSGQQGGGGSSEDSSEGGSTSSAPASPTGPHEANPDAAKTVEVVAVQRLQPVVFELADAFENENPDIGVQVAFAERSSVASAVTSQKPMIAINEEDLMLDLGATAAEPVALGADPMQIIVPTGNPANIKDISAFGDGKLDTGICDKSIPCGVGAEDVLKAADVTPASTVYDNGNQLLGGVKNAQLDAGLLRRSQGASQPDPEWEIITLPEDINGALAYDVVLMAASDEAQTFLTWLTESDTANHILTLHGLR